MTASEEQTVPLAEEIVIVLSEVPVGRVEVTGTGAVADELRRHVVPRNGSERAPMAIVETTGSGQELAGACARVCDGGMVILAGDCAEPVDIDLYRDVHRRGLVLVGVGRQRASAGMDIAAGAAHEDPAR